jgi:hypothetical protein
MDRRRRTGTRTMTKDEIETKNGRIHTLADARDEKRDAELPALAKAEAEIAERARVAAILAANPQIGVLQKATGGMLYYINFPEYIEARDPAWLVGR